VVLGLLGAFRKGLNATGYVEGQNVIVEYHFVENRYEELPSLMADLVRSRVSVIVAPSTVAQLMGRAALC
jgi:putative ABC transport system substrate-binding protein